MGSGQIGGPDEIPDEKIATLYGINYITLLLLVAPYMPKQTVRHLLTPGSISMRSMMDKRFFVRNKNFNRRFMQSIEIPSVNGSLGFANPEWGIGYSYAMNKFVLRGLIEDPKELVLRKAVYRCIANRRKERIEVISKIFA